jgi:uncharacterized SAM-binding protein YcdF (DUF218 family)
MTAPRRPGTVLIVLGAAVWPGGEPSPTLRRRVRWAAELYREGQGDWLLVTGGLGRHPPAEAVVMADLAAGLGVPRDRIVEEPEGLTTWDSARRCAPLLRAHGWRGAILVTDPWHLPRTWIAFRAFGVRARLCPRCRSRVDIPSRGLPMQLARELAGLPVYLTRALAHRLRRGRSG